MLPCLTVGALWVVIWQGRGRCAGVLPVALAFWLWADQPRPELLIADTGGLVGVLTPEGRALSRARGAGFVAQNWLENDGDGSDQAAAHDRWVAAWDADPAPHVSRAEVAGRGIVHATGKRAAEVSFDCAGGVLVTNEDVAAPPPDCLVFDPEALRLTGAVALRRGAGEGWIVTTARDRSGDRLWSQWPEPRPGADQYVRMSPTSRP